MLLQTFPNGYLHMSHHPIEMMADEAHWIDSPVNAFLLIAQAILLILVFRDLLDTYRLLGQCLFRSRFLIGLEHNMGQARVRDKIALCVLPAIIMITHAIILPAMPYWQIICIIAGYYIVRRVLYAIIPHKKIGGEPWAAVRNTLNLYLLAIFSFWTIIVGLGACGIFSADLQKLLMLASLGLVLLTIYISQFTILDLRYGGFKAFLYLCALEFIPATGIIGVVLIIS